MARCDRCAAISPPGLAAGPTVVVPAGRVVTPFAALVTGMELCKLGAIGLVRRVDRVHRVHRMHRMDDGEDG
jgi:hypothetical protein